MEQRGPLKLRVPQPGARPGDDPDFSWLEVPAAGSVRRPAVDEDQKALRDLAFTLIRVLDDEGNAVGPWAPELPDEALIRGLRHMLTLRAYDARMLIAQRQQKTSFYMQHIGEEAISCAFSQVLDPGDMNYPYYRQAGLLIGRDYPLLKMVNQIYSNADDPIKGRQLPVCYTSLEHGFFSHSANLGTQCTQAVGWAMASAIMNDTKIAAFWIGDGATAEGDFPTSLLFASTYQAPVIMNVINNQWAISTFQGIARGQSETFAARGHGYGIPALRVDGNDYLAVYAAGKWAAERARLNLGPVLIEYVTYRSGAHSTTDDPSAYRPASEAAAWPLGEPIARFKNHLIARGIWSEERHAQAEAEIMAEVMAVQKEAEAIGTLRSGAQSPVSSMFEDVYAEMPPHLIRQRQELGY